MSAVELVYHGAGSDNEFCDHAEGAVECDDSRLWAIRQDGVVVGFVCDPHKDAYRGGHMERYRVRYSVNVSEEGWTRAEIGDDGGADALIIGSIIYGPEAISYAFYSVDGTTGEDLTDIELFKAWVIMAKQLAVAESLTEEGRGLARHVFQTVQGKILADRLFQQPAVKPH